MLYYLTELYLIVYVIICSDFLHLTLLKFGQLLNLSTEKPSSTNIFRTFHFKRHIIKTIYLIGLISDIKFILTNQQVFLMGRQKKKKKKGVCLTNFCQKSQVQCAFFFF